MGALPDTQVQDFPGIQRNFDAVRKRLDGHDTADTALDARLDLIEPSVPTYVTSLPGSPVDGQEIYFAADATNGVIWHFRYRLAATKWECVGGSPLYAEVTADETTTSATYAALTTAGPSIALPLAGDYMVEIGYDGYTGLQTSGAMSYDIGGTGAVDADYVRVYTGLANSDMAAGVSRERRKNGLTAVTLTAKYKRAAGAGTPHFANRWMSVTPVRVS